MSSRHLILKHRRVKAVNADKADEDGTTPLSWVAWTGDEELVQSFIEREDVDADSKDNIGRTPLWLAAHGGFKPMVKALIEHGVKTGKIDINSEDNFWGNTAVDC